MPVIPAVTPSTGKACGGSLRRVPVSLCGSAAGLVLSTLNGGHRSLSSEGEGPTAALRGLDEMSHGES